MSAAPLDRWLLVNYAGYPYAPNSLMPDNGLALLAAALLGDGRQVCIMDYATTSLLRRFADPDVTRRLSRAWARAFPEDETAAPGLLAKLGILRDLRSGERHRVRRQRRILAEIADELSETVRRRDIQAVGFKLWNGDGLEGSVELARVLRQRHPDLRIYGGGPHVDIFLEHLLDVCDAFDALVQGEGEATITRLAAAGGAGAANIPNLIYRDPDDGRPCRSGLQVVEDLDALPLPVYDPEIYPAMAGSEKIRILVVDESRGCSNNCAFCIHPVKSSRNLRTRSVSRLLDEIETLGRRHHTRTFRFAGSCTPYGLLNEFARAACTRQAGWMYSSFAHLRRSADADFEAMRASGCVALFFGIESGSQAVLNAMRKGLEADTVPGTIGRARAAGIFTVGSVIYPAPFDNAATRLETLELLKAARPDAVAIQPAGIVPRTDWFERPGQYGVTFRDRERYREAAMRWKVKLLLPPSLWSPLPVRINGITWKRTLKETTRFSKDVEAAGLLSGVSDDTLLMSRCAEIDVRAFRDLNRRAFMAGDAEWIGEMVESVNRGC